MDIQTVELERINPARYNPRKDLKPGDAEYDKLKKSILEFDMVEPLVWNKRTGNLVGGHQRLKVLKELGIEHVEVSVVDLSEVKEKALNLALNKISGEWDMPMLKDLLEELDTGEFDMEITGFDLKEIEDLMTQFHVPEEGLTDDDAVPEATESICRRGDLWSLGNHRLLCGDATVITDVERLMGGEKADMVFTDPPYAIYGSSTGIAPNIADDKMIQPFFRIVFSTIQKTLKLNGHYYVCCDWRSYPTLVGEATGAIKNLIVWTKKGGNFSGSMYFNHHELMMFGANVKEAKEMFNKDKSKQRTVYDSNVWAFDVVKVAEREHFAAKPVELITRALNNSADTFNIILDLFGGSGSTLIACEKLGRRCFMMEISEAYCDVIIKRWQDFTGQEAVRIDGN